MFGWWEQPVTWHGFVVYSLIGWAASLTITLLRKFRLERRK